MVRNPCLVEMGMSFLTNTWLEMSTLMPNVSLLKTLSQCYDITGLVNATTLNSKITKNINFLTSSIISGIKGPTQDLLSTRPQSNSAKKADIPQTILQQPLTKVNHNGTEQYHQDNESLEMEYYLLSSHSRISRPSNLPIQIIQERKISKGISLTKLNRIMNTHQSLSII